MDLFGRIPLRDGTKLVTHNGDTFIISGDPIGAGGYSIVYSAIKQGEHSLYAIKECYPVNKPYHQMDFCRQGGTVASSSSAGGEYLQTLSLQMKKEKEFSQVIFNHTLCVVKMQEQLSIEKIDLDGETFSGEDGIFFLMDDIRMKSIPLHDLLKECHDKLAGNSGFPYRWSPDIHFFARLISEILNGIGKIHSVHHGSSAGYLHGDIQENNIFFQDADLEVGDIGIACFLDFGCMKPLLEDGCTDWIDIESLSSTPGYTPPEMLFGEDRMRLGVQADLYSLGRLFLYMMTGKQYLEKGKDRVYYDISLQRLSPSEGKRIGCRGKALELLNEILAKALAFDPKERYSSAGLMKNDIDELCELTAPPRYSLPPNLPGIASFAGREEELAAIDDLFEGDPGAGPVWLYGIGGIGKTELAIRYGNLIRKRDDRKVFRIVYKKSLLETVASIRFIGDEFNEKDIRQRFDHNLSIMEDYFKDALFIFDDVKIGKGGIESFLRGEGYKKLIKQSFRILFTTRYNLSRLGMTSYEVKELAEPELLDIVNTFYPVQGKVKAIKKLIREVRRHTLTVELIARTLSAEKGRILPDDLLAIISDSRIKSEKTARVMSNKDRNYDYRNIYGHIRALFRLNQLDEAGKITLVHALFFPEEGFNKTMFENIETPDHISSLNKVLIPRGWVTCRTDDTLALHPVLADFCRKELDTYITEPNYAGFINALVRRFGQDLGEDYLSFFEMAGYLQGAGNWFRNSILYRWAGIIYTSTGLIPMARKSFTDSLKCTPDSDNYQLAGIYRDLSDIYSRSGDGKTARLYGRRSVNLWTEHYPDQKEELIAAYDVLGRAYTGLGNTKKALYYLKCALKLSEDIRQINSISYASCCQDIGKIYLKNDKKMEALSYFRKAEAVYKRIYGEEHPRLIFVYIDEAACFEKGKQYTAELHYLRLSLEISDKYLPPSHSARVTLQLQLASLFSNWNLYGKSNSKREINEAFRHVMKALKYAEGMLYQDKLMMISCYRMYGYLYGRQGQYSLAKEYTERSVNLHESIVNRDIDALVVDYSNLALYCSALGMPDLAAVYRNKEMEVKKKADLLHETNEELIQQHKNKDPDSNPPVYDQKSSPAPEKDVREKETQEKEAQDKEAREKEAQDKEVREKEAQDKEVRENDVREKEAREKKLYSAFGWDPVKFRGSLKS